MCGVIGLIYDTPHPQLGRVAAELLRTLEYRGYDSTGAAIQSDDGVWLAKGVGAPSLLVETLGIVHQPGHTFCGQVRWATFGAVTEANSQPHEVRCKTHIYGAHNGNVTNCDTLKIWLTSEGHDVVSDNDGEMVVHTIEHDFALQLASRPVAQRDDAEVRRACMRAAILRAADRLQGSYAAVVVDPVSHRLWAIKQGSSLYFGVGTDEDGRRFAIASSDLSSVLKLTRIVIPVSEGEMVEFTPDEWQLIAVRDRVIKTATGPQQVRAGERLERKPVRSRLRAKDTALLPPFETFMEQEIAAQVATTREIVTLFQGGSPGLLALRPLLEAAPADDLAAVRAALDILRDEVDDDRIQAAFASLRKLPGTRALVAAVPAGLVPLLTQAAGDAIIDRMASAEAGFLGELATATPGSAAGDTEARLTIRLLDALLERDEVDEFGSALDSFADRCLDALGRGGRTYMVCCGSSYHAARAAAIFFNEIAHTELIPILPGEFRGQYAHSLLDGDLFVAVSQSGETKDLIDVMNGVIESGRDISRVALVNNVNSTLAQEKADLVIPLRCGPEIAVPATKSFMNQLMVLYCMAVRLGARRIRVTSGAAALGTAARAAVEIQVRERLERLERLPELIGETLEASEAAVDVAARQLYLAPSIHILATRIETVALEGALKIREVVLNHTEGFEGSEFKHGPNTILGFNTIFGLAQVDGLLELLGDRLGTLVERALAAGYDATAVRRLVQAATDTLQAPASRAFALSKGEQALLDEVLEPAALLEALYADYPLVYVTGPDERDVQLTVSAINTHKIRGASTVVIAEDHPALRQAASKAPAGNDSYRSVFVQLPRTGDTLMVVFSATVVLQRLALMMSSAKARELSRRGIREHGVHPDVPKNVSKSITVD